jgi:superfamily II DNA or RNA helicase
MQTQSPYLGQKGYTVYKTALTPQQRNELITELTVRPFTVSPVKGAQHEYPVYRETPNKYYVPRHYGEKKFGIAGESKLPEGEDINIVFEGQLREYQNQIVDRYVSHAKKHPQGGGGLIELRCGGGKCLAKDTPIMLANGEMRLVQDIIVGDRLMGDDGTPRTVLSLARGKERMYTVAESWNRGESKYTVNESHILSLRKYPLNPASTVDICVADLIKGESNYWGFRADCIDITPVDPKDTYMNTFVAEYLYSSMLADYQTTLLDRAVPNLLVYNAFIRRSMLAGIVDSNHCVCNNNNYMINIVNPELVDRLVFLVRSLGLYIYAKKNERYYMVSFRVDKQIPIHTAHKKYRSQREYTQFSAKYEDDVEDEQHALWDAWADARAYPIQIDYVGEDEYYGFEIDGNRRFVLGDFTITHNTVLTLNIITKIAKKTLILVQRESLADQWVERIQQFIPKARIGRIQGAKVSVDNCDIVLGMLQSISMKEYPDGLFSSFGLVVIDEVHHISSEVFSRALFSVVAKYMLGLSATMERADKTSYVFKMFLGDIVYEDPKTLTHEVKVRAITYESLEDAEYNKMVYDFRGNTQNSTMVAKLCAYKPRTEFIIRVIQDLLRETGSKPEDGAAKIMILAQQKKLLGYIMDAITTRGIATAGYYMGGMKPSALKESETKQIVIGTYAMAQEGLDIKSLTTLVMATPMVNIEQAVGRIMRVSGIKPVVVDIVDSHKNFQNQWRRRKTFYKGAGYEIITVKNSEYTPYNPCVSGAWKTVYKGKKLDQPGEKEEDEEDSNEEDTAAVDCMLGFEEDS